jgi:hypothetical protein
VSWISCCFRSMVNTDLENVARGRKEKVSIVGGYERVTERI